MALEMLCCKVECRSQKLVRARRLRLGRSLEQGISAFGEDAVIGCGEIASTRWLALLDGVGKRAPGERAPLAGGQRLESRCYRSDFIAILDIRYLALGKSQLVELGECPLIRGEEPLHATGDDASRRRSWPQVEIIPAARCEHEQL